MSVLLLATYDTKREEAEYLISGLIALGVDVDRCDISLNACGAHWGPEDKMAGMRDAAQRAMHEIAAQPQTGRRMVVALGGGTGGQIALQVLRSLPVHMPKVLVTTLPFDPRYIIADSSIVLVPTVADLSGLNATTRAALDRAAAITGGLYHASLPTGGAALRPSVGLTALGVTGPGTDRVRDSLHAKGHEITVFHANGFGGAAFARWAQIGAFHSVIDYTPHELTRLHVAGVHADMPERFSASASLPRVVLPGGVNFLGMGQADLMPGLYRVRPHYSHSPLFTHVQCTADEMAHCARVLGGTMKSSSAPTKVLIPMGGFSSEDRPGGAIESVEIRHAFADTLEEFVEVTRLEGHINDPDTADAAVAAHAEITKDLTHA